MHLSDSLSFAVLIVTVITGFLLPFMFKPLLIYEHGDIQNHSNSTVESFPIKISNNGFATANNIIVSMQAKNVIFINSTSMPFLSSFFNSSVNTKENNFLQISFLPPQSSISIMVMMNTSVNKSEPLTLNVFSNEVIAHSLIYYKSLMYILIIVIIGSLIFYMKLWQKYYFS